MNDTKLCKCCGIRKPQGKCTINGVKRNLLNICRYCFMCNPEEKELPKRSQVHYYNKE